MISEASLSKLEKFQDRLDHAIMKYDCAALFLKINVFFIYVLSKIYLKICKTSAKNF